MKLHFKLLLGAALTGLVGFTACGDTPPCGDVLAGGGAVSSDDCVAGDSAVDVQVDSRTDATTDVRTDGTIVTDSSTDGTTGDGSVTTFSIGGSVTNLLGTGLVIGNGNDTLTVAKNATTYTLTGKLPAGATYAVTAKTQPTNPSQTCTISNATGTISNNVTNANVNCTTDTFPISVTVNGLKGAGLVLQNNGADDLSFGLPDSGNTVTGTFATKIASGANYAVSIKTLPADQSCTIAGATGTVVAGPITSVTVTCTNKTYMVGGAVSGLAGAGLVLQNNLGEEATINANGTFAFPTARESGTSYSVSVKTQPSNRTQVCTVTNGSGTVNAADVTNIGVSCVTSSFSVSATVSGLSGTGLVLQNNGGNNLAVSGNGVVTFSSAVLSGDGYAVTVLSNPSGPTQTCTVGNAAGTVGGANVTNVTVSCTTNKYSVGGAVSGLAGSGLVLQNNGGDNIAVSASGAIMFPTTIDSGSSYNVTVLTQPTNLSQTCTVTNGSGTVGGANVTNVAVTCTTNSFVVNANVSGLAGSGLVLQNNGGNNRAVTSNGVNAFSTSVVSGGAYNVTVLTQPTTPSQTCTVTNGSGTVTNANVTATVTCVTNSFTIGGTLSGLTSGTVVLQNNGGNNLSLTANGVFTFSTPIASGATYNVTRLSAPGNLACGVVNGAGTVGNGNVTNVSVVCVPAVTSFAFTGGEQTYIVPQGVTQVEVEAFGAQGGVGTGPTGGVAGLGGSAKSTLSVTPGQTLFVYVGGQGGAGGSGTGGFNSGGAGGSTGNGGGGGGSSDVRQGSNASGSRVVIAGGGGGGGSTGCHEANGLFGFGGAGGAGGGLAGTKGEDSPQNTGVAGGGFGGTVGVGGLKGIGCGGFSGTDGLANGTGGNGQTCCCNVANRTPAGGGGGGGLVVGGGGGGGSAGTVGCQGNSKGAGGGGAGGSNLGSTTSTGVRAGNGAVTITAL